MFSRRCNACSQVILNGNEWRRHVKEHASAGNKWAKKELGMLNKISMARKRFREETSIPLVIPEEFATFEKTLEVKEPVVSETRIDRGQSVEGLFSNMSELLALAYRRLSYVNSKNAKKAWDESPETFEEFAEEYSKKLNKVLKYLKRLRNHNAKRMTIDKPLTECEQV